MLLVLCVSCVCVYVGACVVWVACVRGYFKYGVGTKYIIYVCVCAQASVCALTWHGDILHVWKYHLCTGNNRSVSEGSMSSEVWKFIFGYLP